MSLEQSRYIQNLRSEIMDSKEDAIIKLQDMMGSLNLERADGVQLISRYRSNDKIISLVGIVAVDNNNNSDITIINAEEAYVTKDEFETAINELKEQINSNSGSTDNTEEKDEFGSGYDIDTDYWIHCEYDITNVADKTSLLCTNNHAAIQSGASCYTYDITYFTKNHLDNILSMKIDGVKLQEPIKSFKFETFGKHTVDILLDETTKTLPCMFYGVKELNGIILPFTITDISHNTFCGCSNLNHIQFNMNEIPNIGWHSFQSINENGVLYIKKEIDYTLIIKEWKKYEATNCSLTDYKTLPTTWTYKYID